MKIQAAICREAKGPLSIETIDIEEPRAHEILVRIVASGICHTDIIVRDDVTPAPTPFPLVLGHEGSGVVEKLGTGVTNLEVGDHVVMSFDYCGHCPSCKEKEVSYCSEFLPRNFLGSRMDGTSPLSKESEKIHGNFFGQSSFASHALCDAKNAVKVPKDVPLEYLGPLGCGVQTGAGSVMNELKVGVGQSLAVLGVGSVGLSAIMAAKVVGATQVIAVDIVESRLELAKSLGATHTINSKNVESLSQAILGLTGGAGSDFVVDTTGIVALIREAVLGLSTRGTLGILGAPAVGEDYMLDSGHFMLSGRKIMAMLEGGSNPSVFIPKLIELYRQGRFPFDKMVKFYDFEQINEAISDSLNGIAVKPVLKISSVTD